MKLTNGVLVPRQQLDEVRRDASRFRFLHNLPVVEAQAFFWTYASRKQRAKAIDAATATTILRVGCHLKKESELSPFVDYRRRRAVERSWMLPDSRAALFLQVLAAVGVGLGVAALVVWWL